jgi:hypothetical protein
MSRGAASMPDVVTQAEFYRTAELRDIDPFARELTRRWQAGDISESDALARLFELIARTPLVDVSVKQFLRGHQVDDDLITDLVSRLRLRLYTLMHPLAGDQRTFSLERIAAGASAKRWASNTCQTIVARSVRDHRRLTKRRATSPLPVGTAEPDYESGDRITALDGQIRSFVGSAASQRHYHKTTGVLDEDVGGLTFAQLQAAEAFETRLRALHGTRKIAGSAALARALYGLPRALGPSGYGERSTLAAMLADNPELAYSSLGEAIRVRQGTEAGTGADPLLLPLWDDYSIDDIERLRELPQGVAISAAIAQEAVCPKARPNKKRLGTVIKELRRRSDDAHWEAFVTDLVESYIAYYCETTTEYTAVDREEKARLEYAASQRRQAYLPLAQEVAETYPEARLGTTVDEVTNTLLDLLVDDYDTEFARLEATMRQEQEVP